MKQIYTYEEALSDSVTYFNGDELAAKIFVDKYALQNNEGELLENTPSKMHRRLAEEFARIEQKYPNPLSEEQIFEYFDRFGKIIPQGSPMAGIGNPYQVMSLSNCEVIASPEDSYGGICLTDQELAQLQKRRCGVGFDISTLRPKGMGTKNAAKTTDGIAVFMERFSRTTREVAQGGRRGALLLSLSVHHPEIETFIKIKQDLSKVTGANISVRFSDEFMQAVEKDIEYEQRWPVDSNIPVVSRMVRARDIWELMVDCAWNTAEPGCLFWDTIKRESPADCYEGDGFGTVSTNPCFSGNTLIAVADGRSSVSIKKLAEEGLDVPVYSVNKETGIVEIKIGRRPRLTRKNQKMVRVRLDDFSYLDVTPDHNFILIDGSKVEAKDLKNGDSLPRFTKRLESIKDGGNKYFRVNCNTRNSSKDRVFEHRLIAKFHYPQQWDSLYSNLKENGFIAGGIVVHHKDYNPINNSPSNLEIMSFRDHTKLHGLNDNKGENNNKYIDVDCNQIKYHAMILTSQLKRKFSVNDWAEYAKKIGLPAYFSDFRTEQLGTIKELAFLCAEELGFEYINHDPRVLETHLSMTREGFESKIINNKILVKKSCGKCKKDFWTEYLYKKSQFCSRVCRNNNLNDDKNYKEKRLYSRDTYLQNKSSETKSKQLQIFSDLKFKLGRDPLMKEWKQSCKKNNVPYRVGKKLKYCFKNFEEIKIYGKIFNHKVISIESLTDEQDVYNITVDDNNTVGIITDITDSQISGIFTFQCAELTLSAYDSCRLMAINLTQFVKDPFKNNNQFDFAEFAQTVYDAQRLMDDMIDLELEHIDAILEKIYSDPESDLVKSTELILWEKIRKNCANGRRTGLGITGLGDAIASLGMTYGSEESIQFTEDIYRELATYSYLSSIDMAKDRGPFPVYNYACEKNHPFLSRVTNEHDDKDKYKKYGRRNIANLTTAPTGTISIPARAFQTKKNNITSGIEPAYLLNYTRRRKISGDAIKADFIDAQGDKWEETIIDHSGYALWKEITGKNNIEDSPYYKATANDIDWSKSVDIQAVAQKWICHSISKTCNIPHDSPKELVSQIYMDAWRKGCKGFTVYRDGCRSGVLIETKQKGIVKTNAPPRPQVLPCEIFYPSYKKEKFFVIIGFLGDCPYECFSGNYERLHELTSRDIRSGVIKRARAGHYQLISNEKELLIEDISACSDDSQEIVNRLISTSLRHGADIKFVKTQIFKCKGDLYSLGHVLSRVLGRFIEDEVLKDKCPECSSILIYSQGCVCCKSCGWSKC